MSTDPDQSVEHACLGCADDAEAEFVWHDGLYRSYACADHARDMLPARGRDELRELRLKNGGRDGVVSGYATPVGDPETKVIWKEEVDEHV